VPKYNPVKGYVGRRRIVPRLAKLSPASYLFLCLAYSSNLKMEAICSSEISVVPQRTTRRYSPEDRTLVSFLMSRVHKGESQAYTLAEAPGV
jgi:hypothetical protein